MRIYFVHWHEAEALARTAELTAAGYEVRAHWNTGVTDAWGDYLPGAVVVSLDRLPSHGRAVAEWVWQAKKRRGIPIVFTEGAPNKVEATREKFPDAAFCAWGDVVAVLGKVASAA